MGATSVSLNAVVTPPVKERRLRWMTYSNLLAWFMNFRAFLLKKRFFSGGRGLMLSFLTRRCFFKYSTSTRQRFLLMEAR